MRSLLLLVLSSGLAACSFGRGEMPLGSLPHPPGSVTSVPVRTTGTGLGGEVAPVDVSDISRELFGTDLFEAGEAGPAEALRRETERFVKLFSSDAVAPHMRTWLERKGRYETLIRSTLQAYDLPADFLYLALIESGYQTTARSSAKAVGLWQFMEPTAREMGLRVDEWVDERQDPVRSTRAAARYLMDLRLSLGSWDLATIAYNGGIGRVGRAMKAKGADDFLTLWATDALPRETREYVPRLLAAAIIARDPARYGFTSLSSEPALAYDSVEVEPLSRLGAVARAAGVDSAEVALLNPHLVRQASPPGERSWVRVPRGRAGGVETALAQMDPTERYLPRPGRERIAHVVEKGENWSLISAKYDLPLTDLRAMNPDIGERIYPGMSVLATRAVYYYGTQALPAENADLDTLPPSTLATSDAGGVSCPATRAEATTTEQPDPVPFESTLHTVASGETLSGLAVRYRTSVRDLMAWNEIDDERFLYVGETLVVRPPARTHTVAPGENLTRIAHTYATTVRALASLNAIKNIDHVRPGMVLRLPAEGAR